MNETKSWWDEVFKEPEYVSLGIRWARFRNVCSRLYYEARAVFFPYNVIKIQNLSRTWTDRPEVLFHAMFQILVDYIEIEQPYIDSKYHIKGRCTDASAQEYLMERRYNPIYQTDEYPGPDYYECAYPAHRAICDLYKWYKSREWDIENLNLPWEQEQTMVALCDAKLHELVKHRHHYWS